MPKYRIISELDPGAERREPRGSRLRLDEARLITVLDAESLSDAVYRAWFIKPRHTDRRITAVEEVHPGFSFTDDEITRALTTDKDATITEPHVDPAQFADDTEPLFGGGVFQDLVTEVVDGLRDSGLVPGLHISLLAADMDDPYAMVEVHDDARGFYLSHGTEIRHLTDDRQAVGWSGVLAIARELIAISNDLH